MRLFWCCWVWIRGGWYIYEFWFWDVCVVLLDLVYLCGLRGRLCVICWFWVWFSMGWCVWGWYKTQIGVFWVFYLCLCFLLLIALSFCLWFWSCWVGYVLCLCYFVLYVMVFGICYVLRLGCYCLWWLLVVLFVMFWRWFGLFGWWLYLLTVCLCYDLWFAWLSSQFGCLVRVLVLRIVVVCDLCVILFCIAWFMFVLVSGCLRLSCWVV